MSACAGRRCGPCFYCDGEVTRHEHDHAPAPRRCEGEATVVACANGGCKHFTDGSAIYSTPGTTSLLIGLHDERGFSDVELL